MKLTEDPSDVIIGFWSGDNPGGNNLHPLHSRDHGRRHVTKQCITIIQVWCYEPKCNCSVNDWDRNRQVFPILYNQPPVLGSVQFREHSECFVERLLRLLYWMTIRSEHSLNGSKRQIGVFAIANKDGSKTITQKYPILPRLWTIREEMEYISDTWPFAEQWSFSAQTVCCCRQKTRRSLYWTEPWAPPIWKIKNRMNQKLGFIKCILRRGLKPVLHLPEKQQAWYYFQNYIYSFET